MIRTLIAGAAMLAGAASPSLAQDAGGWFSGGTHTGWYTQAGVAHVGFAEGASIAAGGNTIPGASATLSDNNTPALGIGYRFSDPLSVIAIIGVPPTTTVRGTGPLSGVTVGKVTYGPLIVALNYHFPTQGAFQPFVGAGFNYTKVFSTKGDAITGLDADDAFGSVLRVGFDYMVSDHDGFFFSANKVFVNTNATGTAPALGGEAIKAKIDLNPLILQAGWVHRF